MKEMGTRASTGGEIEVDDETQQQTGCLSFILREQEGVLDGLSKAKPRNVNTEWLQSQGLLGKPRLAQTQHPFPCTLPFPHCVHPRKGISQGRLPGGGLAQGLEGREDGGRQRFKRDFLEQRHRGGKA